VFYDPSVLEPLDHQVVPLSYQRIVQLAPFSLAGHELWLANTHLHHGGAAVVLAGDLNGSPDEPFCDRLREASYCSAYAAVHGAEPPRTFPSGLRSPGATPEPDQAIDYVWLRGPLAASGATLALDTPHPDDPTLYPSDHLALVVDLEVTT
jgi:endonuclease/exonuclease/phosphatase family metal-dependent hydrolase